MGQHQVEQELDERKVQAFMSAVLDDLRALDYMIDHDGIESGVHRVGAEQEMFLVDRNLGPAPLAVEVLDGLDDPRLTTEIARFNLEANVTPQLITGDCFSRIEQELNELLAKTRERAAQLDADILLAGILPTLRPSDLTLDNISPNPRYHELNRAVTKLRGGPFSIHIKGLDELQIEHDNIMMESCNTSFQVHFQCGPREFAAAYNIAQAITAPVLAAAVNSPVLFGQRLWQETRLALFQHSADERSPLQQARSQPTRVGFGERWLRNSVIELLQDQLTRFRPIMISIPEESSLQVLARGETPRLAALFIHNGTVWPWNRACYGVSNGVAQLRIENRALPAGPTVPDEVANTAFFIGLMLALPQEYGDISKRLDFDDAKTNFFAAARYDLHAQLRWIDNKSSSAASLIRDQLLPLARQGLEESSVDASDIDKYLGIIGERIETRQTGARWLLKSLASMEGLEPKDLRYRELAARMLQEQKEGKPVHKWEIMSPGEDTDWSQSYQTVEQFMTTDLFTVRPDDLVDLAASVMDWRHVRHVPVEDDQGRLVGLVTHRALLHLFSHGLPSQAEKPLTVREIMKKAPFTVSSSTPTLEAMEMMQNNKIGCLPVVDDGRLVGILTSYDFLAGAARIFREYLGASNPANTTPKANAQHA
ncbi:MAG TPA: CBS domain-containing protein [Pyrinomonadaceae bacterium]|nr:CBS domain-containing protein [Pyrinomonadaceae bacterium]